jgi:hypothetical protein
MFRRDACGVVLTLALAGYAGCTGTNGDPHGDEDVVLPDGTHSTALLPAGIRRLTNAEYDASARALTSTKLRPSEGLAPDARQNGYTVNGAQVVDSVLAKQLAGSAEKLAAEVKGKINEFAPCADAKAQAESCATEFIKSFGGRAYRRPLDQTETDALLVVYGVGAKGAGYADGIELVVRAVLQSAGFLYLTELGDGSDEAAAALTPHELATSISYLITGGPPDTALLDAATAGKLTTPEGREAEVRRLLSTPGARERVVRVIREWLGIDRIAVTAKDSKVYPEFAALKASMEKETEDFVGEVMSNSTGTVGELLGADWTFADAELAKFYGATGQGRVSLPNRRGILNQGAFLSVNAHATESAPVLRGVTVARRVVCDDIPAPTTLNINIVPPLPDPNTTTRERFSVHTSDDLCRSCHNSIDPLGFSFERFDGMGKSRELDNGKPVDSKVEVTTSPDFNGPYADSSALAEALSSSTAVRWCFALQMFRASTGHSGEDAAMSEATFMEAWSAVPAAAQGNIAETLITYVKSSLFSHRRAK